MAHVFVNAERLIPSSFCLEPGDLSAKAHQLPRTEETAAQSSTASANPPGQNINKQHYGIAVLQRDHFEFFNVVLTPLSNLLGWPLDPLPLSTTCNVRLWLVAFTSLCSSILCQWV